jgi:hypothetical protein
MDNFCCPTSRLSANVDTMLPYSDQVTYIDPAVNDIIDFGNVEQLGIQSQVPQHALLERRYEMAYNIAREVGGYGRIWSFEQDQLISARRIPIVRRICRAP